MRTTSTRSRIGAGLKKCMPTTRSGCAVAVAIAVTESAEVFVASTASGATIASSAPEELALRVEVLDDRLDHEVAAGQVGAVRGRAQPPERGVALLRGHAALLDAAAEVVADPLARLLGQRGVDLDADRVDARLRAHLRDPGSHRAEADDADGCDLPGHDGGAYRRPGAACLNGRMAATVGERKLLVAGEWVETGAWREVLSPFSGEEVGRVARGRRRAHPQGRRRRRGGDALTAHRARARRDPRARRAAPRRAPGGGCPDHLRRGGQAAEGSARRGVAGRLHVRDRRGCLSPRDRRDDSHGRLARGRGQARLHAPACRSASSARSARSTSP